MSFALVDLSRLPAPNVIAQLDYETIFADLATSMVALVPGFSALVDSDPAVKVLQVAAYREMLIRQAFADGAKQVMTAYATGPNLEQLSALVGVTRLEVTPADTVANLPAFMEDDDSLRRRIVLAPNSFSVTGPESAYVFHALSAAGGIRDASATSPSPGEVVVTILADAGTGAASPEQIAAVEHVVTSSPIRPLTDHVTVVSAEIIVFTVEARLWIFSGPDETVILTAAQTKLAAYIAASRHLGRDITLSGLYAALHVEGVQRVDLLTPTAPVIVAPTQAAFCAGANVQVAGYDEWSAAPQFERA